MASNYSWHSEKLSNPPNKPSIDDMEAGIGCMLGKVQRLINEILDVMKTNNLLKKGQLDGVRNGMNSWFEKNSGKTFYELIGKYVSESKPVLLKSARDEFEQINNVRKSRNYFVHQFHQDYFKTEESGRVQFLRSKFKVLLDLNNELDRIINRTQQISNKANRELRSKTNVKNNEDRAILFSEMNRIYKKNSKGKMIEANEVITRVCSSRMHRNIWKSMGKGVDKKLNDLGFKTITNNGTLYITGVR